MISMACARVNKKRSKEKRSGNFVSHQKVNKIVDVQRRSDPWMVGWNGQKWGKNNLSSRTTVCKLTALPCSWSLLLLLIVVDDETTASTNIKHTRSNSNSDDGMTTDDDESEEGSSIGLQRLALVVVPDGITSI